MSGDAFEIVPCGDDAFRVLCGPGAVRHALADRLRGTGEWVSVVVGKRNVTVEYDPHAERGFEASERLKDIIATPGVSAVAVGRHHVLEAEFGGLAGPDLDALADRLGVTEAELVERIEGSKLEVDMLGFTPGFAYVAGLDASLEAERLANPRQRVDAGSIGLITGQIGLYALAGPAGWPIVGRVLQPLFDRSAADPFVLKAGDTLTLRGPRVP